MPRSTIIADRISKYDKIINDNRTIPDVELAIFKLAICQLVDTVIGGGGGGGGGSGSTSSQTITEGIDSSVDINTIIARLSSIDTKTLSQSDIVNAIQSAADIDTIVDRLTSIVSNTASSNSSTVITTYSQLIVLINSTGGVLVAANPSRKGVIIVNKSSTVDIDLFFGAIGLYGTGLPLRPNQSYDLNTSNLYLGAINAIAGNNTTANLAVLEGV